ncbi:hypothetical protein AHAS_Ahas06G0046500 [Arachis hypogaea]
MIYTVVMSPQCGLWNLEASIFNLQINLCGRDLSDSTEFTSYGRRIFMERTSLLCLKTLSRRSSFPISCDKDPSFRALASLPTSDMFLGFDENDGDDDIREEFLCPFCSEYFDIVGLCCHIDEEHPVEAKNGVCPVCTLRVGVDMVAHITLQHGNILKISFFTCV